ncbi:unnamed protein product [Phaedon cochleariae]|uniref:Disks large-associated protein 5 n=1 Tax=Phaedon cochleariae TaxID=80249 RepID=A0A9N9SPE1_PHACE|nr:unnamed protein product [Phaedon cochleariae]
MNVSEAFKKCMQDVHKKKLEKNYHQKTIEDRLMNFQGVRRQTRDTLMLQRRNIDLNNMSPIITPQPTRNKTAKEKIQTDVAKPAKSNKRLEMLQKWKEEKEKVKLENKRRAKPIFKVCHVTNDVGISNLGKVNKEIKGKPIKKDTLKSSWAPVNHKFHAPKNIKPISVHMAPSKAKVATLKASEAACKPSTSSNTDLSKKNTSNSRKNKGNNEQNILPQNSPLKRLTRAQISKSKKNQQATSASRQKSTLSSKTVDKGKRQQQENVADKSPVRKVMVKNNTVMKESKIKEQKKANVQTPLKKKVAIIGRVENKNDSELSKTDSNKKHVGWDVHNITESDDDVFTKSSTKKKYAKTPIKRKNTIISITDSDEDSFNTPPKKNQTKNNHTPKSGKSTPSSETRSLRKEPQTPRSMRKQPQTPKEDKVTIYSDEEVSLKTPRKSASRKSMLTRPKTPKSARKSLTTHAPIEVEEECSPAYISPFVTISRGKDSARKEFKSRLSTGGTFNTPDSKNKHFSSATSPKMGAEYFAKLLNQETARIEGICQRWEKYRDENELSEEAETLIFVPIGQSRLLIAKKFQQFRGLIEKCRKSEYEDEKPITCKDLHGFWDMIYMQVGDLEKRFAYLEKVKENNWEEVVPEKKQVASKRPKGRPKKPSAPSRMRDFIKAARNKKGQPDGDAADTVPAIVEPAKSSPLKELFTASNERFTPSKERFTPVKPSSTRRSLRVSLLCGKALKRPSTSPCLAMMKISQAIKAGDGVTPSKSILKTERTRSESRMTKSVLFEDDLEKDSGPSEDGKRSVR